MYMCRLQPQDRVYYAADKGADVDESPDITDATESTRDFVVFPKVVVYSTSRKRERYGGTRANWVDCRKNLET